VPKNLARRSFGLLASAPRRSQVRGQLRHDPIATGSLRQKRKERKQFCAFSACARFRTAWVNLVVLTVGQPRQAVDVKQVARKLGVRYVLEGSVRKGNSIL
jgi:hypothetical protein